jgi:hypothetical protein
VERHHQREGSRRLARHTFATRVLSIGTRSMWVKISCAGHLTITAEVPQFPDRISGSQRTGIRGHFRTHALQQKLPRTGLEHHPDGTLTAVQELS